MKLRGAAIRSSSSNTLEMIKCADWISILVRKAAREARIVGAGAPEEIVDLPESHRQISAAALEKR